MFLYDVCTQEIDLDTCKKVFRTGVALIYLQDVTVVLLFHTSKLAVILFQLSYFAGLYYSKFAVKNKKSLVNEIQYRPSEKCNLLLRTLHRYAGLIAACFPFVAIDCSSAETF